MIVYLKDCRKKYLHENGDVDWDKVSVRWSELSSVKISLANKYFTPDVKKHVISLPQQKQQSLLDIMIGGLENQDSNVGAYATTPDDYDTFDFYLEPLIREYHGIVRGTKQEHDWNIPTGQYLLTNINPGLKNLSMRARVARNVSGWNLPQKMNQKERLKFEQAMVNVFEGFGIKGKYRSLTPGHKDFICADDANQLRRQHFLFNDMTQDKHFTSSGLASDWPYGRGIWLSDDRTKMIWVGQQDQLGIISIIHGTDLGLVDRSLYELLQKLQQFGLKFAEHPVYGVITTCPTNMGTGKRQSILGKFPNITNHGKDEKKLKSLAKTYGLQARGMGGEHSAMDKYGTADISSSAKFGVKESFMTQKLYKGLIDLYNIEYQNQKDMKNEILERFNYEKSIQANVFQNQKLNSFKFGRITFKSKKQLLEIEQEKLMQFDQDELWFEYDIEDYKLKIIQKIIQSFNLTLLFFKIKNQKISLQTIEKINFQFLTELTLVEVGLRSIEAIGYINSAKLQKISFSRNQLTKIQPLNKTRFKDLRCLKIDQNLIKQFDVNRIKWIQNGILYLTLIKRGLKSQYKHLTHNLNPLFKVFKNQHTTFKYFQKNLSTNQQINQIKTNDKIKRACQQYFEK